MLRHSLKFILLLFWLFASGTKSYCQFNQQDSLALVALFNSTNGPSWTNHTNWLTGDVPTWFGVTPEGSNVNVERLDLSNNHLVGTIPASLGNITFLQSLNLSGNSLSGLLPGSILRLSVLNHLDLSHNQIADTLRNNVGGLTAIQQIDLSFNLLKGPLPDSLYFLTTLTSLRLNNNLFTGEISKSVGNMVNLQELLLQNNHFDSRIPGDLDQLSNLVIMNLSSNWFIRMDRLTNFYNNGAVTVAVENNRLQFEDIEDNFAGLVNFTFIPQDSVGSNKVVSMFPGEDFYIQSHFRYPNNSTNQNYQWYKDFVPQAETTFDIPRLGVTPADAGIYYCVATDPAAGGLVLTTHTITLNVLSCGTTINNKDSLALVALFNSLNGSSWTNKANWLSQNINTWFGVTVTCDRVTSVVLTNNNLSGTLPAVIGDLTALRTLDLSGNQITGGFPASIRNMRNLNLLALSHNQLSSPLPPELGKLTLLEQLYLDNNNISGRIPDEIGDLSDNLFEFIVYVNQLTGPINPVTRLYVVSDLGLSYNHFTGHLPEAITDLPRLYNFFLEGNRLSGTIPLGLDKLQTCVTFSLGDNQFSGTIPPSVTSMSALTSLSVRDNQITGTIPSNIGNLASLKILDLSHNPFDPAPFPNSIVNCSLLEEVSLEGCSMTGSIPALFGNLTSLRSVNFGFNLLTGSIPPQMGNLTNLTFLSLADNDLTGPLPTQLGNLINLGLIDLSRNQLSASIPASYGNWHVVTAIDFFSNQLTGSIPVSFGNLAELRNINLSANQLTGQIPKELALDTHLNAIFFYGNQLSGSLPKEFGTLQELITLDVFTNQLSGTLPIELGQCLNLEELEIAENQFTGSLPPEYATLTKLKVLQINDNNFTGAMPPSYLAWTQIHDLYLTRNDLTSIPNFPGVLGSLHVEDNMLTFESLEPYFTHLPTDFQYIPQDSVGTKISDSQMKDCPYTVPANVGGSVNSYQWYKDGVLLAGKTSATLTLPSLAAADAAKYTCAVTNSIVTGLTLNTLPLTITVNARIDALLNEDPTGAQCNVRMLIATPSNLLNYQWFLDGDKMVGATNDTLVAYYDGDYTVVYQPDPTTCKLTSLALDVIGLYADNTPVITVSGDPVVKLSTTFSAVTYQWYVNDKVIANATTDSLAIWYNGNYYLVVSLANNCQYRSNTITVDDGEYNSLSRMAGDTVVLVAPDEQVLIYPNPTPEKVTIQSGPFPITGIEFYDNTNKSVYKKEFESPFDAFQIDVSNWSPGIYMISISSDEKRVWRKLVKY